MRVLLTHPYLLALDPREAALVRPYPPLGTLQVAANLRAAGHDVVFVDPMFETDARSFARALDEGPWDLVAVVPDDHSVQIKQCLSRTRDIGLEMCALAKKRGITVVVSGPDASDHPAVYQQAGADAVFRGEVAEALVEWTLPENRPISGVVGLGGAGDGRRAVIRDLDAMPDPDWSLCDLNAYAQRWRRRHGQWELNIWTARGCPYRCNWCAKPVWGRSYHVRSAERVAAEILALCDQGGPDRLWFTDDIFALRSDWLKAYRRAMGARTLPFRCLSRADLLCDDEYVGDLAAAGCDEVWIGAESGSDKVLRAMDKDCSVDQIRTARRLARKHGIRIGFFLQLGYPGEALEDVRATVRLVDELRPDLIGVSVSYPMPGTKFFERVADSMGQMNWSASMDNLTLFDAPYDQSFYDAAKQVLRSTHSAGRARASLRALLTAPSRHNARKAAGAVYHRLRLPLARARMHRLAIPNAAAVPLTW
ncbi:MAG: radical SAM protein [Myxococcota bacterium]